MLPSSLTVQQKARVFAPRKVHSSLILTRDGAIAWGLYYRALRIRNLRKNERFFIKLVSIQLAVINARAWTNTLAYYRICTYMN